ncbi:a20-like zinc finger, partial [Teladorsagia circumcincta]
MSDRIRVAGNEFAKSELMTSGSEDHDNVFVEGEENELSRRLVVQINEKDLLCVNGCGFYGTPQWGNRCSKCWREHQLAEKRSQDYAKN